jgi:ABC-type amino acid transport substrate-binding protein
MNVDSQNRPKKLRVAVIDNALPYSNCKPIFEGITIDIWKRVAEKYNLEYEFLCYKREYDNALHGLNNNEFDVVIADMSVISRRYNLALYSRPFFISDLHIYRKKKDRSNIFDIFKDVNLSYILLTVILIVILYTILVMYIMKLNFLDSFYKTFLSFLTVGGEIIPFKIRRINPHNIKIINTAWALILFFFRAFIITRILSVIVTEKNTIVIDELEKANDIIVLKGSAYVDYVKQIGKNPVEVATTAEIIDKMKNSNSDEYWFEDPSIVSNELKKSKVIMQLDKTERAIINDEFTIAVNKRLPEVLNMINTTLVDMQNNGEMLRICKGYLTENYDRCLL